MPQTTPITDAYIDEIIKAPDAYNPTLNKTQGVKLRELIKLMRDKLEQAGGAGNLLTAVTYTQLVNLIATSALVPGAQYLLTDYKMYWKPFVSDANLRESDNVEPLILSAISVNKISAEAKSTLHPRDIIYYSVGKLGYDNIETPYDESDSYWTYYYRGIVPVKGVVFRRIDVNRKLDINFDYKGFWVENSGTHLPIESQLRGNVSIIQNGLDNEYTQAPVIIPFATLKNTRITIGFNGNYGGNGDKLCPATFSDLKLQASNSEIDFYYIKSDEGAQSLIPQLVVKDSKLTKLFWMPTTPPNWNKVLNFSYTANYEPNPGSSTYAELPDLLTTLASTNVKVSVDYNWDHSQYTVLETSTAATSVPSAPSEMKYFRL